MKNHTKPPKNTIFFFKNGQKILKNFFSPQKCYCLSLPNEEISLRPELAASPCFRILGGSPERDIHTQQ